MPAALFMTSCKRGTRLGLEHFGLRRFGRNETETCLLASSIGRLTAGGTKELLSLSKSHADLQKGACGESALSRKEARPDEGERRRTTCDCELPPAGLAAAPCPPVNIFIACMAAAMPSDWVLSELA